LIAGLLWMSARRGGAKMTIINMMFITGATPTAYIYNTNRQIKQLRHKTHKKTNKIRAHNTITVTNFLLISFDLM